MNKKKKKPGIKYLKNIKLAKTLYEVVIPTSGFFLSTNFNSINVSSI